MQRNRIGLNWLVLGVVFSCASMPAMAIDSAASGDWHVGATWVGGTAPTAGDDANILNTHVVTVNEILTTYSVDNLTVQNGGVLTHTANGSTEQYKILFSIAENLTVESGGAIDVSELGYAANQGPGESDGRAGASHGGEGGFGFQATTTHPDTYGSINNPINLGSGSASHIGGGAIVITVGGALTNNGTISATGASSAPVSNGGGSGGSVNIETATIAGNGTIDADGGEGESGNAGGGGGGGRVSIRLTGGGADFSSVTLANITAVGGPSGPSSGGDHSAAGTVHLKTAAQTYGDLIIRGIDVNGDAVTPLRDGTFQFDSITVTNFGTLAVTTNGVLNLTGTSLHHDSTTNSITSRIIFGQDNGSLTLPASFSTAGILSKDGTAAFAMTTDLTIESGGILTHEVGSSTEDHKLNLSLTGNLTVDSGGAIYVAERGYTSGTGPGASSGRGGPGHGGEGGLGFSAGGNRGTTYGSITNPTTYGTRASYQNRAGGGAIIITASGSLTNNGLISAEGESALPISDNGAGGAGGSINLKVATIAGSGDVTANGGDSDSNAAGGGGGGRIAVRLTQSGATFASYGSANFSASGGSLGNPGVCCTEDAGAAGTIYLKFADASYGDLIVDNADTTGAETLIPTSPTDTPINDVELRNEASVNLPTGSSFTVYGNWSNAAPTDAFFGGGSVVFAGAATGTVYGSSIFEILTVATAGKLMQFEAGTVNTATEEITLLGSAVNDVFLRSTLSGTQWGLNVAASVSTKTFQYLDVQDSDAFPGTAVSAIDSEDSGNNSNWVFSVVGLTNTWTGASSTTWSDGGNWSLGAAPSLDDAKVTIPTGAPLYPILDGPVDINELEMQASTTLSINNQVLTVNGDTSIAGTLTAAGSETITFFADLVFTGSGSFTAAQSTVKLDGTDTMTFTPLSNTFNVIDIANSNTVTVTDGFTVGDLTFPSTSANVSFGAGFTANNVTVVVTDGATLTFTAGQTYTVNNHLQLTGASGNLITLTAGGSWDLDVDCFASVSYASVLNSDASGGRTIYAASSTDGGGNSNWNFALGKVWAGTTDDWATAGNWTPTGVPGAASQVIIDGSGSSQPRITSGTTIAGLTVVGINAAATLTVDLPFAGPDVLTVSGDVEVRTNATLTHTAGSENYRLAMNVSGNVTINPGGAIDVAEQGFTAGTGPGVGNGRGGAGHGGQGGKGFQSSIHGTTYGSITNPVRHGSSSSYSLKPAGGGAIILTVSGALTNNGVISADGESAVCCGDKGGGGAGGSINLTLGTLAGSSTISADGGLGDSNAAGGGGGGRVAIRLTGGGATFASFGEANITAAGGDLLGAPGCCGEEPAAAGTVYLETSGGGTVTIDNNALSTTASTHIRPATDSTADELTGVTVRLTNTTAVVSTANETIGDLLIYDNSFWTLDTWTVTVNVAEHSLEDQSSPGPGATNRVDNYSQIIWVAGGIDPQTVIKFE
jgi:hypothetical protein